MFRLFVEAEKEPVTAISGKTFYSKPPSWPKGASPIPINIQPTTEGNLLTRLKFDPVGWVRTDPLDFNRLKTVYCFRSRFSGSTRTHESCMRKSVAEVWAKERCSSSSRISQRSGWPGWKTKGMWKGHRPTNPKEGHDQGKKRTVERCGAKEKLEVPALIGFFGSVSWWPACMIKRVGFSLLLWSTGSRVSSNFSVNKK